MKHLLAFCSALIAVQYVPQVCAQWRDVCPEYLQCANMPNEIPSPSLALSNGRFLVAYSAAPTSRLDGQSLVAYAEIGADGSFRSVDLPFARGQISVRGSTWMVVTIGGVSRSFDEGQTWQSTALWPGGPQIDFVDGMYYPAGASGPAVLADNTAYIGYSSIRGFRLYTSKDAGQTWTSIKTADITYATLLAGSDDQHVRASTGWDLYETADEGATWQKINANRFPTRARAFYRDATSRVLYVATDDGVLRSTDDGHTFAPFGLAGQSVYAIGRSANGVFHAGVKTGIVRSMDGGASWHNWSAGLYPAPHTLAVNGDSVLVGSSMGYFHCASEASCAGEPRRVNLYPDTVFSLVAREFYNSTLDHYFITGDPSEAAGVLDGHAGPGWSETGDRFYMYAPLNGVWTRQVCRFYGSPTVGPNSHFFTASISECDALRAQQLSTPDGVSRWNDEGIVFSAVVPSVVSGACPSIARDPVYRLYNNGRAKGIDPNHRYTTSVAERDRMIAQGWLYEGVAFCAAKAN